MVSSSVPDLKSAMHEAQISTDQKYSQSVLQAYDENYMHDKETIQQEAKKSVNSKKIEKITKKEKIGVVKGNQTYADMI